MAESEGEIEYLEEDAEIVQQCVLSTQHGTGPVAPKVAPLAPSPQNRLLVERPKVQKRKRVTEEYDSEYDPSEEELPPSPPSPPIRKKRVTRASKPKPKLVERIVSTSISKVPNVTITKLPTKVAPPLSANEQYLNRKKYNIRIPDYDDPLCLPVRATKTDESDRKRLDNWNNVCLEHFKQCDTILKPEQGETKGSIRTAVFKNVFNKQTGNNETTIWSKTCVENKDGDKKSEIFQCILPRYKEKKVLGKYVLSNSRQHPLTTTVNQVILSKEEHKDGEVLVVYKPEESMSAVYGLVDKRKKQDEPEEKNPPPRSLESRLFLQERVTCKLCAPCFQASWRGLKTYKRKSLVCPICARNYVTIYNLLAHYKTHSAIEVRRYKKTISQILAEIVGHHYKCRICRKKFPSIKALRGHVVEHQKSKEKFQCEVCNRMVNEV